MIEVRKSHDRGDADHGWLKSKHTFSFAGYYDEKFMGFGPLRVINEDRIDGGTGFGTHGHRDMEIISYVVDGALEHQDSMGNKTVIRRGEVQRMSAGTGVQHSEYNHRKDGASHFLQIWVMPERRGITPGYEQKSFATEFANGDLVLVVSKEGRDGSITINQDVNIYAATTAKAGTRRLPTSRSRRWWLQVIKGDVRIEGETLTAGDGAAVGDVDELNVTWTANSEFILFDMP